MRRRLAKGVRMYTGDDFNYAELIAGDEQGYSDALLGIFDAIAPAASAALAALAAGDRAPLRRHPGADRPALAPHLQGAHALLQDRRRVHGLPQRPAGSLRHGRRPAERALAAAPGRAVPPRRPRRPAARPRPRPPPHECTCWPCTGSPDARLLPRHRASLDQHGDAAQAAAAARHHRGLRAARHPRHLSLARPGRRRRPRKRSRKQIKDAGLVLSGYCRGGFFTAADAAGLAAALEDNRRAIDEAAHARRALPRAGGRRAAGRAAGQAGLQRHRARPLPGASTASPPRSTTRRKPACRSPSSRCIPCRRPTAPASTRWSRRSTSATRSIPAAPARSASRSTSITCGGTPSSKRQIARAGRERLLAYHVCDWLDADARPPQRPRHDGRRRHRAEEGARLGRGRRLHRLRRGRDLLRPLVERVRRTRCSTPASRGISRLCEATRSSSFPPSEAQSRNPGRMARRNSFQLTCTEQYAFMRLPIPQLSAKLLV